MTPKQPGAVFCDSPVYINYFKGSSNFSNKSLNKLILMALISLNCIITIIIYAPFVRLLRKYLRKTNQLANEKYDRPKIF